MIRDFVLLGLIGVCKLLSQTGALPIDPLQFGAMGLCGLMVWQLHKRDERMGKVVDQRQKELLELYTKLTELHEKTLTAIEKCKR
jgi:hypothetical protein